MKVEVVVPDSPVRSSPYGLCGRTATLDLNVRYKQVDLPRYPLEAEKYIATRLLLCTHTPRPTSWLKRFVLSFVGLFNAELSPERCWRGPRSQEVGEEGDCT